MVLPQFVIESNTIALGGTRALEQVLPSWKSFLMLSVLVAEVLESNGSSSQASICAGTLALMAGGVPIKGSGC